MAHHAIKEYRKNFRHSMLSGFAWAIGVTLGFAFISTVLVVGFKFAGGLPLIGDFVANIMDATNESLLNRTPLSPQ